MPFPLKTISSLEFFPKVSFLHHLSLLFLFVVSIATQFLYFNGAVIRSQVNEQVDTIYSVGTQCSDGPGLLDTAVVSMYHTRAAQEDKWSQPGWRIEKKYTNKALLGNWEEERLQFNQEPRLPTALCSTSRADYRPHWDVKPDSFETGSGLLRAEGLPAKLLFAHQGSPCSHGLVTHYEESYGRKRTNALPTLQPCHQKSSTWLLQRPNTVIPSYPGLQQLQRAHVDRLESHVPSLTVYRSSYQQHPLSTFCQGRFARASRWTSSHLHRVNHLNKDLDLRHSRLRQVPDQCVRLPQSAQHA